MNSQNDKFREDYYNDNYVNEQTGSYGTSSVNVVEADYPDLQTDYEPRVHAKTQKPRKKKRRFLRFIFTLICIVMACLVVFFAFGWIKTLSVPQKTNFLIMATDEAGTRTDTLMLGTFDKKTKGISLISIPRDTYVTVSDESFSVMNEDYPQPSGKSMKINTVHHFAGEEHGAQLVCKEVEKLMNVDINYYIKVDFDAFRYIIDSVGGIEFYVPQDMQYSDPYQDLYIDLKEGEQILDGEKAEHLLRYRSGYANADIGRIEVQQNFMKAFISQTLSKGTILSNPGVYLNAIFKYDFVETNAGASDIAAYAMLVGGIDSENIQTMTLPGSPAMRGGQSVYLPDVAKIENEVSKIVTN